jgi:hypothetical protein
MAAYTVTRPKARKLSKEDAAKLVKEVRDNIELHWNHERPNIEEAERDNKFRANDHWPEAAKRQREAEGRPMLTFNRMNQFINQVVNPIKQADIAIKTNPVDGNSDPELSKVYNGLLRQIQYQSSARAVYGHALESQAGCGIGAFRICHDYRDGDSFDQELYLERINNPLSVFWDPAARDAVRSDAMWMGIAEAWPVSAFEARWPDASKEDVEDFRMHGDSSFWFSTETVRVAEYFRKVKVKKTLAKLQNGAVIDVTGKGEGQLGRMPIVATRTVNSFKVESFFVSGAEVLEGPIDVPGTMIPIVLVLGGEVPLDKGVYRYGVTRFARDAQMMYNLTRTAMAESIGMSPKAKWLVPLKSISKHMGDWENQNKSNKPYLPYTPVVENGALLKPERTPPIEVQPALTQDALMSSDDMKAGTGIFDASQGNRSNETSGVAIDSRKMQGEVANYGFLDNFKSSLEHAGRILCEWIPLIYDTERVMRIVGENEASEETVPINRVMYGQDGLPVMVNDLSAAKFDIRVSIGPSYSTRRQEMQAFAENLMKALPPEMGGAIADLVVSNSDMAGADEIAGRLRAMIEKAMPGVIEAGENAGKGNKQLPPPQQEGPPPELMMQQVMLTLKDMAAKIEKTQSETAKNIAQTEQIQAQTGKTVVETASVAQQAMHAEARLPHELASQGMDAENKLREMDRADQRFPHELEHQRAQTRNLLSPPQAPQ